MLMPPQQQYPAIPSPSYYFSRSSSVSGKMEAPLESSEKKIDYPSQHHIAIDMRGGGGSFPFFQHLSAASGISEASKKSKLDQIIADEVSMWQSRKPPAFRHGIAAATAVAAANPHQRKVGAVQLGMTGMY